MTVQSRNQMHRRAAAKNRRQLGFDPSTLSVFNPFDGISTILTDLFPPVTASSSSTESSISSSSSVASSLTSSSTESSSTESSTTSSTAPSTTVSTPTPTPTTTGSTPSVVLTITTGPAQTALVTQSIAAPTFSSSSSIAPTNTSNADNSSGLSTGAVVGGIGAGIVAIAAIGFAAIFFIRRSRKRSSGGSEFDANTFRRSGVMLEDEVDQPFNPRPPTMIERHMASPAPTFGTQYGRPGPQFTDDYVAGGYDYHGGAGAGGYGAYNMDSGAAGYGAGVNNSYNSFGPGQIMNMQHGTPSPITATSAHPIYQDSGYGHGQSPFSPMPQRQDTINGDGGLNRQLSSGSGHGMPSPVAPPYYDAGASGAYGSPAPVLTRNTSNHSQEYQYQQHQQPGSPSNAPLNRDTVPVNDYVDLSRSSVSPFQAEQYVEISRRLNTEVPEGLKTTELDRELPPVPVTPTTSNAAGPFADPKSDYESVPPSPGGQSQYAIDNRDMVLDFPVPPPVHTLSPRVESMPPMLPEINLESRVSVSNYPGLNPNDSHALGADLAMGNLGNRLPTTPSPLASSFGLPSPLAGNDSFDAAAVTPPPAAVTAAFVPGVSIPVTAPAAKTEFGNVSNKREFAKKRASMHSVYDAEDAYGGI